MNTPVRNGIMKTTVEMKPEHYSALLALAARRGQMELASILAEAVEQYLNGERRPAQRRKELLSLAGSLSVEETKDLRKTAMRLRKSWH